METLRRTSRTTLVAVTAAILAISSAFGYWLNVGDDDKEVVAWIVVCIVGTLIAAALLLRFVPATEAEGDGNAPARRALVLGALALVTMIFFWTGLPIVLGVPALVLGAEGRARAATHGQGPEATAGAVLGGFAVIVTVVAFIAGA
jgi:peptidoglycan/LPS O-acetylase OafA/YrhL